MEKQAEQYRQILGGATGLLSVFLQVELNVVYDFLMRMTGDFDISLQVVREKYLFYRRLERLPRSYEVFRQEMYCQVREMARAAFYKDTSRVLPGKGDCCDVMTGQQMEQAAVHATFLVGKLGLRPREVMVLAVRVKFGVDCISKIIQHPTHEVERLYQQAVRQLQAHPLALDPVGLVARAAPYQPYSDESLMPTHIRRVLSGVDEHEKLPLIFKIIIGIFAFMTLWLLCVPHHPWSKFLIVKIKWLGQSLVQMVQ
ncbi:MAG: hypothetical protein OXT67_13795 [Zetaproteobacteria bacterium]|nr:hypothetical protein [Zetaproteobacteria bacterium]